MQTTKLRRPTMLKTPSFLAQLITEQEGSVVLYCPMGLASAVKRHNADFTHVSRAEDIPSCDVLIAWENGEFAPKKRLILFY